MLNLNLWNKISSIGIRPDDAPEKQKTIRLINHLVLLAVITVTIYIPYDIIIGHYFLIPFQAAFGSLICLSFLFMQKRWHQLAYNWMFICVLIDLLFVSIELPNAGYEYYFFPITLGANLLYSKKSSIFFFMALCTLLFMIVNYLNGIYIPHQSINPAYVRITYYISIICTFILIYFGMLFFRLINANYELIIQDNNFTLKQKNKEITDSINYAKEIQDASLPQDDYISQITPNSFVLYLPKDIVSGDFYFFHKHNNHLFIAVADCTGHGVPGALLSILSTTKLAETVAMYSSTDEILFHLNQKIKLALNQNSSRNSNVDGMDIALCRLDTDSNTLEFSGANRPLWIIRKNSNELEEIKSTRRTIAGFTPFDQTFPSSTISINEGDVFYMFSDGYPDAIGGPDGKKLMTKSFKEILLSISHKSMPEQKAHLGSFNRNWRGHTKQNDDILVVGVRV